jgi:hypothetical protein
MAKAVRTKKLKEVIEEPITEVPKSVIEQPETIIEETPVTDEGTFTPEPPQQETVVAEPVKEMPPPVQQLSTDELTKEQKIIQFLDSRDAGEIKLNDFLKSLYPLPRFNEPPQWLQQSVSRQLKALLEGMQQSGDIKVINDTHRQLGAAYYPDTTTGRQHHHNLNTMPIMVRK